MATINMETSQGVGPVIQVQDASEAPSGFILKLFQMVNGAPDEVISVSLSLTLPILSRLRGTSCFNSMCSCTTLSDRKRPLK